MPETLLRRRAEADGTDVPSRCVNEFLAVISHELLTPVTAILGWAEVLGSGGPEGDRFEQAIRVIRRNAELQARLVGELLDYSRVFATGELPVRAGAFPLAAAVSEAVEAVAPAAYEKRVHVAARLDPAPGEVEGDLLRLRQAFTNLLSNAIRFTPPGGVVRVVQENGGPRHTVTVSDEGEGISADLLPFVFDPYRRGGVGEGLGLGLAIARHIVELHEGTIGVDNAGYGRGAVFTVRLPACTGRTKER